MSVAQDAQSRAQVKSRFIPTSAEVKAYVDANEVSRRWARNELMCERLYTAAMEAHTVEALREVIAAAMLLLFVNNDPG